LPKTPIVELVTYCENKEKLVRNYSKYFNNYALSDGKAYKRISDVILKN